MDGSQYFPEEIWKILSTHDMTEKNTEILRNYFTNPTYFDPDRKTIVFSVPSRTGTSFFRTELPMYAIATKYPEKFNLVYADNNLNPRHLQMADYIETHRAGHLHCWLHDIYKAWPKTQKRAVVSQNVDDNEYTLPAKHPHFRGH